MGERKSAAAPMLAAAIVLAGAAVGAYIAAYLWIGKRYDGIAGDGLPCVEIAYQDEWQVVMFGPARDAESRLGRIHVTGHTPQDFSFFFSSSR